MLVVTETHGGRELDRALLARCKEGDNDAFRKFVVRYERPVFSLLSRMLGSPSEGPVLKAAYAKSADRIWSQIKPLCVNAIGAEAAEKLGVDNCTHAIVDIMKAEDPQGTTEAFYEVGEIRSGMRPVPSLNTQTSPVLKMFLVMTAENGAFENDLAQAFGPEEAHRLAYSSDGVCTSTSSWGAPGPRGH